MDNKDMNRCNMLSISMLGELKISYGNRTISECSKRSGKIWNLLAYLITYRNKNITQGEFIDLLWPSEECDNPGHALKTMLYRIRLRLKPVSIGSEEYIISSNGSYQWNNVIPCSIDVELFEHYLKLANDPSLDINDRITLYMKGLMLYKGDFLSYHSNELWVMPLHTRYHSLYINGVVSLGHLLEQVERYDDVVDICSNALQIDSCEERIHSLLIRAFLKMGNHMAALSHYELTTDILYQNLGVKASDELRALYRDIMAVQKTLETDLSIIQSDLREMEYEEGAFVCEYGFFQVAYQLQVRQAEREGRSLFICLLTLTLTNGELPDLTILGSAMERLLNTIVSCLRRGDVIAKYSGAQYIIMLPTATYEDCSMIMERIINTYYAKNNKSKLHIQYKVEKLEQSS